jgi:hypothetical protein
MGFQGETGSEKALLVIKSNNSPRHHPSFGPVELSDAIDAKYTTHPNRVMVNHAIKEDFRHKFDTRPLSINIYELSNTLILTIQHQFQLGSCRCHRDREFKTSVNMGNMGGPQFRVYICTTNKARLVKSLQ